MDFPPLNPPLRLRISMECLVARCDWLLVSAVSMSILDMELDINHAGNTREIVTRGHPPRMLTIHDLQHEHMHMLGNLR